MESKLIYINNIVALSDILEICLKKCGLGVWNNKSLWGSLHMKAQSGFGIHRLSHCKSLFGLVGRTRYNQPLK